MGGDTIIDNRSGEVLDPKVDSTYWKDKVKPIFIVFMDHKITYHREEGLHTLNGIGILGT